MTLFNQTVCYSFMPLKITKSRYKLEIVCFLNLLPVIGGTGNMPVPYYIFNLCASIIPLQFVWRKHQIVADSAPFSCSTNLLSYILMNGSQTRKAAKAQTNAITAAI